MSAVELVCRAVPGTRDPGPALTLGEKMRGSSSAEPGTPDRKLGVVARRMDSGRTSCCKQAESWAGGMGGSPAEPGTLGGW